jgi:dinuclear metal center YbgI/SA1388 family protein
MKLHQILTSFESVIPLSLQESWDHCGLNLGNRNANVTGVVFSYDACLEAVAFAQKNKAQLIVSHHPFRMKAPVSIDLETYEGRLIEACVKNGIALYSAHTNHDRSDLSLNRHYLRKLGLKTLRPLALAQESLLKLAVFVPREHTERLMDALFAAGAGGIGNYSECSFRVPGLGTFKGNANSHPRLGERNRRETVGEDRVEALVTADKARAVVAAMKQAHPYEEVAYDLFKLENRRDDVGMGMFGDWDEPVSRTLAVAKLKTLFRVKTLRFAGKPGGSFKRVGICTGSGASLIPQALAAGCDLFITGDLKYHQAVEAKRCDLAIADVGHFYSEIDSVKILKTVFTDLFGAKLKLHDYVGLKDAFEFV